MDYYKAMDFSYKYTNNETVFELKNLSKVDRDEVVEDMQDWETYMYCKEAQERLRAPIQDFPPVRPSGDLFAENIIYFRVIDEQSKTKCIALGYRGSPYSNEETYYSNVPNISSIDVSNGEDWDEESGSKKKEEMVNLAKIYKARGNEAYKAQDFKKACESYSDCISCGVLNVSSTAFNNRAQANMKMGNFTVAISDLNEVLETDPKNVKALFRRATCRKEMKMYREALKDLDILSEHQKDSSEKKLRAEIEKIMSTLKGKSYRLRENSGYRETFQVDESQLPAYAEANKDCLDYLIEIDRNGCLKKCVCNHCTYEDQSRLLGNNRLRIERPKWKPLSSKLLEDMEIIQKRTVNSSSDNDASSGDSKAINTMPKDECDSSMNALKKNSSTTIVNDTSRRTNVIQNNEKTPSVTNEMKALHEYLRKGINLSNTNKIAEKNDVNEIKRINLKETQPISVKEVYGNSLDESILTSMMNSICRDFTFNNEWQLIAEYLEEVAQLKSFTTFINLVDKRTRGDVLNMLESASSLKLENADNLKELFSS